MSITPITPVDSPDRAAEHGLLREHLVPPGLPLPLGHPVPPGSIPGAPIAPTLVDLTRSADDAALLQRLLAILAGTPTGAWLLGDARRLRGRVELASDEDLKQPGIDEPPLGAFVPARASAVVSRALVRRNPMIAAIILAHELQHLRDWRQARGIRSLRAEARANAVESLVARELGAHDTSVFAGLPLDPLDMERAMQQLAGIEGYSRVPTESVEALPGPLEQSIRDILPASTSHVPIGAQAPIMPPAAPTPLVLIVRGIEPGAIWAPPEGEPPYDRPYGSNLVGPVTGATPTRRILTGYDPVEAVDEVDWQGGRDPGSADVGTGGDHGSGTQGEREAAGDARRGWIPLPRPAGDGDELDEQPARPRIGYAAWSGSYDRMLRRRSA